MSIRIFNFATVFLLFVSSTPAIGQGDIEERRLPQKSKEVELQKMAFPSEFKDRSVFKHDRFGFEEDTIEKPFASILLQNSYTYFNPVDSLIKEIKSKVGGYHLDRINVVRFYIIVEKGRFKSIYLLDYYENSNFRTYLSDFIQGMYLFQDELIECVFKNGTKKEYGVLVTVNF